MPFSSAPRALALDRLALARRQRAEEIVERRVAAVLPVELLVGALEEAVPAEQVPFGFRRERDVHRRRLAHARQFDQACRQRLADRVGGLARGDEQPPSGRGRERHRHLQLGVIAAAGALVGLGPAGVEHVFAARVGFQIAGHHADDRARRSRRRGAAAASRCAPWPSRRLPARAEKRARRTGCTGKLQNAISGLAQASHAAAGTSAMAGTTRI